MGKITQRGHRSRRNFPFSDLRPDLSLEARQLTAPLFARDPGNQVEGQATTANSSPITMTNTNVVQTGNNTGSDVPPPPGSGSIAEVSEAYTFATIGSTGGIEVNSTLQASLSGTIDAGVADGAAAGANTNSQNTAGAAAPLTWTVSDSGGAKTTLISATFSLQGTIGAGTGTNLMVQELATLTLVSNQISVYLNTNGVTGLEVINNTAAGGPKVVYTDQFAGWYRGDPSGQPPEEQSYGAGYTTPPMMVSVPFTESIAYASTLNVGTLGQIGAGRTVSMTPNLHWALDVT